MLSLLGGGAGGAMERISERGVFYCGWVRGGEESSGRGEWYKGFPPDNGETRALVPGEELASSSS